MKIELRTFQQTALEKLRGYCILATADYMQSRDSQIISFAAPTGAGKTIILSALLESIFMGDECNIGNPNSVAVWLSDDPELNEQSKEKIETRADRIPFGQCKTITEADFDQEVLDDGKIYFINTQKFAVSSNLTKHSDSRQFTIWETLQNTIREKGDRLYFIIDEAHRGAKGKTEAGKATTIMQKFILGDPEHGLSKMPVVIGMSATMNRFNQLIGTVNSTIRRYEVPTEEVQKSGLLKDKIIIAYPEEEIANKDMAILQAATEEWIDKSNRWFQYCQEQHYAHVYPIMLVQVENGTNSHLTSTDIDDCLVKIQSRYGRKFREGEVVHAFGSPKSAIVVAGLNVPYIEPSRIAESRNVKVVFFKDALSTGWDCPRAETMMSFRRASDSTYIAQLLGRMIRTPMQMRIQVDETLNEVKLFLPHFNQETVEEVIASLKEIEGGDLPTEVSGSGINSGNVQVLSVRPVTRGSVPASQESATQNTTSATTSAPPQTVPVDSTGTSAEGVMAAVNNAQSEVNIPNTPTSDSEESSAGGANAVSSEEHPTQTAAAAIEPSATEDLTHETVGANPPSAPVVNIPVIDRIQILDFINSQGFINYNVRKTKVNDYLKSLFKLTRLLTQSGIATSVYKETLEEVAGLINDYIRILKDNGQYESATRKVMEFRLKQSIIDTFGEEVVSQVTQDLFSTTDTDVDRQYNISEAKLGSEGVGNTYGQLYGDPNNLIQYKLDVILYVGQTHNLEQLQDWAKIRFHAVKTRYRMDIDRADQKIKEKWEKIVKDGDAVSETFLNLPYDISLGKEGGGIEYYDHLYVDSDGKATFVLNTWEVPVLAEEKKNPEFLCWLRNPDRKPWALCVPYEMNNEQKPMYPDFLIVRDTSHGLVVDILEPHDPTREDNLPKAKGLAKYAASEQRMGRIQMIRLIPGIGGTKKIVRLDFTDSLVRDKVLHANTPEQLTDLFNDYGITQ